MNWPTPAQGPGCPPPQRSPVGRGSWQVPEQDKDLGSEGLALTLCRPCGKAVGLFYSGGGGEGNAALSMQVRPWSLAPAAIPWRSPARGLLARTSKGRRSWGRGDALCRFGDSDEEKLM